MGCHWNLLLPLHLAAIWQKFASGLPVAIFCQIDATQYKNHEFLRGRVQWLATGNCHLLPNFGFCCHLGNSLPLAKKQCKFRFHIPLSLGGPVGKSPPPFFPALTKLNNEKTQKNGTDHGLTTAPFPPNPNLMHRSRPPPSARNSIPSVKKLPILATSRHDAHQG